MLLTLSFGICKSAILKIKRDLGLLNKFSNCKCPVNGLIIVILGMSEIDV